jgi:hypothetical protein
MYCRTLGCYFGAQFDPGNDEWRAIKVYRDGNEIEIARFGSEDEAELCALHEWQEEFDLNSQFGVGA